jgi:hypothetical protein
MPKRCCSRFSWAVSSHRFSSAPFNGTVRFRNWWFSGSFSHAWKAGASSTSTGRK